MNAQITMVEQWDIYELTLEGPSTGNPFKDVQPSGEFSFQNRTLIPDGFYDGGVLYKIRFMPDVAGQWRCRTISNIPTLNDIQGHFIHSPASSLSNTAFCASVSIKT